MGLVTALLWGTGDWVSTLSSAKIGSYATTIYSCVLSIPLLTFLIIVLGPSTSLSSSSLLLLSLASIGFLSAYVFAYGGYHSHPLSVVAPIAYTAPAIAIVLDVVFLDTRLTIIEAPPLAAVMVGVILLSTKFSDLRKSAADRSGAVLRSGVVPGLAAAGSYSFVFVVLSVVVPKSGYLVPTLVLKVCAAAIGFCIAPLLRRDLRPTRKMFGPYVWLLAIFDTAGYLTLGGGIASAGNQLPLVIMTSGMGGFFLACYGMAFKKEKPEPNQLLGIAISIIGVATLLYLTA